MIFFEVGERVAANRDIPNRGVKKGETGVVTLVENIQSDEYLDVLLDESGLILTTSSDSYWNKVE